MFEEAKKLGDILVVTLTADIFVNKGPGRPMFSQGERVYCLSRIKGVDNVEICHHKTGLPMIEKWKPDFYVKGADYKTQDKHGSLKLEKQAVEAYGGKVVLLDQPLFSASSMIERLAKWNSRQA
jgi:bifunctional ADP-heptose synthase (sugar kinase/adenylyltransferase)